MTTGVGSMVAEAALAPPAVGIAGTTAAVRTWAWAVRRFPIVAYLAVYLFTCYVGALALWWSRRFQALYLLFSGAELPALTHGELLAALALLHAAPVVLWLGFELGVRGAGRWIGRAFGASNESNASRLVATAWLLASASRAAWALYRTGGFENFGAWVDYNAYVYARWRLFDQLGHWDFVNLYTLLPVAAAYLILKEWRWTTTGLTLLLVGLLQYPLANRKVILTSAILIAAAAYVHLYAGGAPRRRAAARWHLTIAVGAATGLYLLYVIMTLMQVVSVSAHAFKPIPALVSPPERRRELSQGQTALQFVPDAAMVAPATRNRAINLTLYVLLSPLTRTSVTAFAYPAIFPRWRPYYHVDVAQDMLRKIHPRLDRFGRMPDDNLVVYHILWPNHHRGSIAAPYQFVLYSQGGLLVALVGSLLMGLLTAACWVPVLRQARPTAEVSVLGGLAVVFGVFLAIDSVRNSTLVSYGLFWGALPIVFLALVYRSLEDRAAFRHLPP